MFAELLTKLSADHASGVELTVETILTRIDDLDADLRPVELWAISLAICTKVEWRKALARARHNARIIEAVGCVPKSASEFIESYAATIGMIVCVDGRVKMASATGVHTSTESDFARKARILSDGLRLNYSHQTLNDATEEYIKAAKDRRRGRLMSALDHDPTASVDWLALAKASLAIDPHFASAAIQHWMWQVKRKQRELPIEHHLMLIFGGAQNVGKSTFAKAIFSPIAELTRSVSFSALTDDRIIDQWSAAVLFLDEMSFASKADADEVKNVITAETLDRRPMRSNRIDKVPQLASLIGTTNKVLDQIIRDTTGARRFCYLPFTATPDRTVLNAFNWTAAWQSVDETAETPLKPFLSRLAVHQEDARARSVVEQWITSLDDRGLDHLQSHQAANGGACRREKLFECYATWQDAAGIASRDKLDMAGLTSELRRLSEMTAQPVFRYRRTSRFNGFVLDIAAMKVAA